MKKLFLRIFSSTIIFVSLSVFAASVYVLGLDNNGSDSYDSALETLWPDEELDFKEVAAIVGDFVYQQYKIRTSKENIDAYKNELEHKLTGKFSRLYEDLPDKQNGHPMNRPDKKPDARGFAVKILNKKIDLANSAIADLDA